MNIINKIKKNKKIKKNIQYNILIIQIYNNKKIGESRPCYHCIKKMEKSYIKIKNVYYSTKDNKFMKEKLKDMLDKKIHLSKGYRNN